MDRAIIILRMVGYGKDNGEMICKMVSVLIYLQMVWLSKVFGSMELNLTKRDNIDSIHKWSFLSLFILSLNLIIIWVSIWLSFESQSDYHLSLNLIIIWVSIWLSFESQSDYHFESQSNYHFECLSMCCNYRLILEECSKV